MIFDFFREVMEEFQIICVFDNYRKAEQLQYCWSLLGVLLEHGIDEFADLVGILIDGFESIVKYFFGPLDRHYYFRWQRAPRVCTKCKILHQVTTHPFYHHIV